MYTIKDGDVIGIVTPSWVADREDYARYASGLEKLGFRVKFGKNIYRDTYGYIASTDERVDDFNEMIYDDTVKMVFFGGGYGSVDLLPYIDYQKIQESPKIFLSYSDGTSILNAIYAQTGIPTFYGQTPGLYAEVREYDRKQFVSHFIEGNVTDYVSNSKWYSITEGCREGTLIGGYLVNFVLSLGNTLFPYRRDGKYILFIEESEQFQSVYDVGMFLTCIGQSQVMKQVSGLLFGHYSDNPSPLLFEILERFGRKYHIPVAYCDDFGHGANHAIFPIGREAVLDTKNGTMFFR